MTTKFRNEEATREMRAACLRGEGRRQVTLRQNLETTIGAHSLADQAVLLAKSMGLQATVESAGGWFVKQHLITVDGEVADALHWLERLQAL